MFEKVIKSAKLISLPEIYFTLKKLLDSSNFTLAEVATLVSRDPAIAARFLRVINNPLNRRVRVIESIDQAVNLLGVNQVHDIVLSISVAKTFEGLESSVMDMKKFWRKSFFCAVLVKQLAFASDKKDRDRIFAMGLLHDIGHLAMYTAIPEESQQAILVAREQKRPLCQVEKELFGFDYAEVGKRMANHWGLPESYQAVIGSYPNPGKEDPFAIETALLHLGHLLVSSSLENGVFGEGVYSADPGAFVTTGLTEEQCLSIRQEAAGHFNRAANIY